MLFRLRSDEDHDDGPEYAVRELVRAWGEGDCDRVVQMGSSGSFGEGNEMSSRDEMTMLCELTDIDTLFPTGIGDLVIEDLEVSRDARSAIVTFIGVLPGGHQRFGERTWSKRTASGRSI